VPAAKKIEARLGSQQRRILSLKTHNDSAALRGRLPALLKTLYGRRKIVTSTFIAIRNSSERVAKHHARYSHPQTSVPNGFEFQTARLLPPFRWVRHTPLNYTYIATELAELGAPVDPRPWMLCALPRYSLGFFIYVPARPLVETALKRFKRCRHNILQVAARRSSSTNDLPNGCIKQTPII